MPRNTIKKYIETEEVFDRLQRMITEINTANGWRDHNKTVETDEFYFPALIALMHSELSEALEGYRINDWDNVMEELADTLIRIFDAVDIIKEMTSNSLASTIFAKLEKNLHRGYKHGNKVV